MVENDLAAVNLLFGGQKSFKRFCFSTKNVICLQICYLAVSKIMQNWLKPFQGGVSAPRRWCVLIEAVRYCLLRRAVKNQKPRWGTLIKPCGWSSLNMRGTCRWVKLEGKHNINVISRNKRTLLTLLSSALHPKRPSLWQHLFCCQWMLWIITQRLEGAWSARCLVSLMEIVGKVFLMHLKWFPDRWTTRGIKTGYGVNTTQRKEQKMSESPAGRPGAPCVGGL